MSLASDRFRSVRLGLALGIISSVAVAFSGARAAEHVLHAFQGGSDGDGPNGGLLLASGGTLYGVTGGGGGGNCHVGDPGCGTLFSVSPTGVEAILYAFQGGNDAAGPNGRLVTDSAGNLYGNSGYGGANNWGAVFKLTPDGTESVLYSFADGTDGGAPIGNLAIDGNGNLYGTNSYGGDMFCLSGQGCGTVFEVSADGAETPLYAFQGGSDGLQPEGGVIRDSSGNLYGTTVGGGGSANCSDGCGTVFKVASNGTESVLYAFQAGLDGAGPQGLLIADASGNLYGVTSAGGGCSFFNGGCGTVFKVTPEGNESILYAFQGGSDGWNPRAGLVRDKDGNLYGTTYFGGGTGCKKVGFDGCGTVFKLTPNGAETRLISFGGDRGKYPAAGLLLKNGKLYGTANGGGAYNDGTVFSLPK